MHDRTVLRRSAAVRWIRRRDARRPPVTAGIALAPPISVAPDRRFPVQRVGLARAPQPQPSQPPPAFPDVHPCRGGHATTLRHCAQHVVYMRSPRAAFLMPQTVACRRPRRAKTVRRTAVESTHDRISLGLQCRPRRAEGRPGHAQGRLRAWQAAQAAAPAHRPGDRRLFDDRRGRSRHGVPVGRQGQLRAARHPAVVAASIAAAVRARGRQPRPEAAGLSRRRAAALSREPRGCIPDCRAGHVQRRQAADPRRGDDVLAVLATAPWRAVSRRDGDRRD